jgi:Uma2 family endonuclease
MVELKFGPRTVGVGFSARIEDVSEKRFDELVDEDTRAELINGVMYVYSPASPRHDQVSGFLRGLLMFFADTRELGQVFGPDSLVRLKPGAKVCPDIFFFRRGRLPRKLPAKQFQGAPDFVAEVLSPSNRSDDFNVKRPAYQDAGVKEIWLINPDRQEIFVDRRQKKGYDTTTVTTERLECSAVKGFWVEPTWLWADPLPSAPACLREILGEQA